MLTPDQLSEFLDTLKNPRFCQPEEDGPILLEGTFRGGKMDFFASPTDAMDYGRSVWKKAIDGFYGPIAPYDPTTIVEAEQNAPIAPEPDANPETTPTSTGLF
jgi:hypothetical protein